MVRNGEQKLLFTRMAVDRLKTWLLRRDASAGRGIKLSSLSVALTCDSWSRVCDWSLRLNSYFPADSAFASLTKSDGVAYGTRQSIRWPALFIDEGTARRDRMPIVRVTFRSGQWRVRYLTENNPFDSF
jgi:hypothetical protein